MTRRPIIEHEMVLLGVCTGKILIYRPDKAKLALLEWVYSIPYMHDFFLNACRTWMTKNAQAICGYRTIEWIFTGLLTWVYADFTTVFAARAGLVCLARFVILTCGNFTVLVKNFRREKSSWTVIDSALPWLESFVASGGWKNTK